MKQLLDEYKTLRNQKQFLKVIYANLINRFGDSIDAIAFTWLVYQITNSATWSAIVFGVNMIPTIIIQPFAGAFVENMKKRNIMVICDFIRAILVTIIAISYLTNTLTPWILLIMTVLNSSVEALRVPAGIAIAPHLLDEEYYEVGIALNSSGSRAMELVGTACAGLIIGLFGIASAIIIDAITFALSGAIIASIKYSEQLNKVKISVSSYFITLKEGFVYIRKRNIVIVLCICAAFLNMMVVPINSFLAPYVSEVMKGGSEVLSFLTLGITIGSIIGSFFYPLLMKYLTKRRLLLITTLFISFFYISSILLPPVLEATPLILTIIIVLLFFCLGLLSSAASTFAAVLMTSIVEPNYLARVGGTFGAIACFMIPVSSLIVTILLKFFNFQEVMLIFGVGSLALFIIYLLDKRMYLLDEHQTEAKM